MKIYLAKRHGQSACPPASFFAVLVLAGFAAGALVACGGPTPGQGGQPVAKTSGSAIVFAVTTTRAVEGQISNYIELNGDVEPSASVDVYADTAGKLNTLHVRLGQRVAKDEVIAEIDQSRPGFTFVASPVKAPLDGTIISLPYQVGATIPLGVPIAKIAATDRLEIISRVAERFISKMRVGLDAVARFEAVPDEALPARVVEIAPVVDSRTRTLEITLRLARADRRVKSGMFARVKVITERKSGIVKIPAEAVVRRFGETFVFNVVPNQDSETGFVVERVPVNSGIQIDDKLEIVSGLKPFQEIVVQGQTLLEDGSKVKVVGTLPPLDAVHRVQ